MTLLLLETNILIDAERSAHKVLLELAETALGPRVESLRKELEQRLLEAELKPESVVWKRAFQHHWTILVSKAWGIPT